MSLNRKNLLATTALAATVAVASPAFANDIKKADGYSVEISTLVFESQGTHSEFGPMKDGATDLLGVSATTKISSRDKLKGAGSSSADVALDGSLKLKPGSTDLTAGPVYAEKDIDFENGTGDAKGATVDGELNSSDGNITTDAIAVTVTGDITAKKVETTTDGKFTSGGQVKADRVKGHVEAKTGFVNKAGDGNAVLEGGEGTHYVVTEATDATHKVASVGASGNLADHYEVNNAGDTEIDHKNVYAKKTILKGAHKLTTLKGEAATFSRKDSDTDSAVTSTVVTLDVKDTEIQNGVTLDITIMAAGDNLLHGDGTAKLKALTEGVKLGDEGNALAKAILGDGESTLALTGTYYTKDMVLKATESTVAAGKTFGNHGRINLQGNLEVASGGTLNIVEDGSLDLNDGFTITNGGTFTNSGTLHARGGTITGGFKTSRDIDLRYGKSLVVDGDITVTGTDGRVRVRAHEDSADADPAIKAKSLKFEGNSDLDVVLGTLDTNGVVKFDLTGMTVAEVIALKEKIDVTVNPLAKYRLSSESGKDESGALLVVTVEENSAAATKLGLNKGAAGGLFAAAKMAREGKSDEEKSFATALSTLLESEDKADLQKASELTNTVAPGASVRAVHTASRAAAGAVSTRLASLRQGGQQFANLEDESGVSSGDEIRRSGMWLKGSGSLAQQGERSGLSGYDSQTRGLTLGMDSLVRDDLRVGLAFSTAESNIRSKGADKSRTDVMSYQAAAYGSYEPGSYFVEGQVAYALNTNDAKRTVAGGDTVKGDFKAHQYSVSLGAGVPFGLSSGMTLTPKAGLFYSHTQSDKYTETGTGALTVKPGDSQILEASLGTSLSYEHTTGNGAIFRPELRAAALYEFLGDNAAATAKYSGTGATFQTLEMEPAQLGGTAGLGVSYTTADGQWEVRADYDAEVREDYISHNGMLTGRFNF